MPTYSSYNSLGASIEAGEITDGAVTQAKMNSDNPGWDLLETLSYSADTTKTSGTLDAYGIYMIEFDLLSSADSNYFLRLNGDTSNNYSYLYINGTTVTNAGAQDKIFLATDNSERCVGRALIGGLTKAVASGENQVNCMCAGSPETQVMICGRWAGGNATQVTSITFYTTQTVTGEVRIYGKRA